MRLRGPGELLGTRQHGLPVFRVADLVEDLEWLERARDDAATILHADDSLSHPDHAALRHALAKAYGGVLDTIDVA